jgi:exonuclease III
VNKSLFSFVFGLLLFVVLINHSVNGQGKAVKMVSVAFYNFENLFDTINDPDIDDEEFLPEGRNEWNSQKYYAKLKNLAEVISQIGDEYIKGGPSILGFSEVENRTVVEDLINTEPLKSLGYDIVHFQSADRRGIDVGLIYRKNMFKVVHATTHRLHLPSKPDYVTRDVVVVAGMFENEKFHILVNHWPSRSGGELETAPYRAAMATLCRSAVDSIFATDKKAKIIIMGDLNDDPTDASLVKHLKAKGKAQDVGKEELFNPMVQLYRDGIGSLAYRDTWNLFDQLIVSSELLNKESEGFVFYKARVFNRKFLLQKEGQYKGYPFRTYAGGVYTGGYSDHLPVYLLLTKEKK